MMDRLRRLVLQPRVYHEQLLSKMLNTPAIINKFIRQQQEKKRDQFGKSSDQQRRLGTTR
ncbi:hypothetical protein EBZ80_03465 [bacterium]|nr:hypothetical protein [bacterium]